MKKTALILSCVFFLLLPPTSCKEKPFPPSSEDFKAVEHVGTVSAEFENIISNNLFHDVKAFADRLLVSNTYREYADSDHNTLWQRETSDDFEVTFLRGTKGGTCKTSGDDVIFYDDKEQMIGRCIMKDNQLELVELGTEYNAGAAIDRIREWQQLAAEKDWLNEMLLQTR